MSSRCGRTLRLHALPKRMPWQRARRVAVVALTTWRSKRCWLWSWCQKRHRPQRSILRRRGIRCRSYRCRRWSKSTANKGTAKFCSQCGEIRHFDWTCAKCGESNSAKARFCCNCGVAQEESERIRKEAEEEERKRLEEERRIREEEERKRLEEERRIREKEERKRLEEERRNREEEERRKAEALNELKNQEFDYPHPLKFYDGVCPKCGLKHYNNRPNCVRCGSRFKQED